MPNPVTVDTLISACLLSRGRSIWFWQGKCFEKLRDAHTQRRLARCSQRQLNLKPQVFRRCSLRRKQFGMKQVRSVGENLKIFCRMLFLAFGAWLCARFATPKTQKTQCRTQCFRHSG